MDASDNEKTVYGADHDGDRMPQKHLTVSFQDVNILVHGQGEDFAPTFTSVVANLIPTRQKDIHFPTLTVGQTINFATATKLPGSRPGRTKTKNDYLAHTQDKILSDLGIAHTRNTIVGNEFMRGVSGGERKRVSLAEVLATQAPLQCWDNSTRGLDASNALDFAKVLRRMADEEQKTIIATLYQAGNGIYDLFDKVLVLAEGREIYYGLASEARHYFESMGFTFPPGANVADFLTGVAVPTERMVTPGFEGKVPNTAEEFETRYKSSATFEMAMQEIQSVSEDVLAREIANLKATRDLEKNRTVSLLSRNESPYHVSFFRQVNALTVRMHPWFRWIAYINPASYAFEAVIASEMGHRTMECVSPQLVPFGPSYSNAHGYQSCTVQGSDPGQSVIHGDDYVAYRYQAYSSHIWRNVGILIGFWLFFAFSTAVAFEVNLHSGSGSRVLYNRGQYKKQKSKEKDPELAINTVKIDGQPERITSGGTVFTFKNIKYTVRHEGQDKLLLDSVSGFVKPGQLVALMGSSGAGKTTLMDVLAQRKDAGRVEGSIMVNGKPQGISFQRATGYCEQNDVHEPTATVLEALLFSARLRQPMSVPDLEKRQHVIQIMDLLELTSMQHAIIGSPGEGLSIEQRKRLTLAVELVAKPALLFLDEPTSGLDGQSAYEICRFMRKLSASGQTVICTIHQPSATLFENFDVLLLLARGGKTTYFGPTGVNSSIVLDYFSHRGAPCGINVNPAEHIVDVVQGRFGTESDWPQEWLHSDEYKQTIEELDALNDSSAETDESKTGVAVRAELVEENNSDFATTLPYQIVLVTQRQLVSLWRNPDYAWNKISLHITNALFGGFTFWKIGNSSFDLQLRLMAVFNFVFVAPGCINQMQPFFIRNRDLFETREKKSKAYHWLAFISAQLLSEIPLLVVCATVYFAGWYFTAGLPVDASRSGQVYLQMIFYEFLYTSIGQAIAAYSPNEYFASLANPLIVGAALINFCGVVVPYSLIPTFWRYWLYWMDPFTYLIDGLLEPVTWGVEVECTASELTTVPLPPNTTCADYISEFLSENAGYVTNPENTTYCDYCPYKSGSDYMRSMNINESYYGWRDVGITALFCVSSYALVFLMMKLRTKATKTAS
ncbi:ABC multidrug transporter [Grosmannia clavigera kw1407]|uniref:ABC multidrug transporter n=1 Tax=Grosmannia clavigera (strain kw1407 / UAMH 11150) TaxID=655863 RepID=F0XV63_GROCL|nr:ABC multidrug transporter [Grosmannia clavigera kw1407]EFW98765.1 ABC multidrug transporter [Grosmannia clavigera kw1407]